MSTKKKPGQRAPVIVGTVSTLAGFERLLRARRIPCNVVEIRFDLIGLGDLPIVLKSIHRLKRKRKPLLPVLGTFRSHHEGGAVKLSEPDRLALVEAVYPFVDLIDVEASSKSILRRLLRRAEIPVIVSLHDFRATPTLPKLRAFVRSVIRHPETIAKIACNLRNPKDMDLLRQLLGSCPKSRVAAVGMGRLGPISRFWLPYQGSVLTYGYLDRSAAPGQVSAEELAGFFGLKR